LRPAEPLYLVGPREVRPQCIGQLGVAGKELIPIDDLPAIEASHVLFQD
jgi:hypothetical protein